MKKIVLFFFLAFCCNSSFSQTKIAEVDSIINTATAISQLDNLTYYVNKDKILTILTNPSEANKAPNLWYTIVLESKTNPSHKAGFEGYKYFPFEQMQKIKDAKNETFYIIYDLPNHDIYKIKVSSLSRGSFYNTKSLAQGETYKTFLCCLKYFFITFCAFILLFNFFNKKDALWQKITNTLLIFPIVAMFLPDQYLGFSIILLAVFALINLIFKRKSEFKNYPYYLWLFPIMYLVRVIWLSLTPDLDFGMKSLETELSYLALPFVFAFVPISKENIIKWLKSYILIVIGYTFISLIAYFYQYLFLGADISQLKLASVNLFAWDNLNTRHQSFMAVWALIAIAFSLYVYFNNKTKANLILAITCFILSISFALLTGSRVALVVMPILIGLCIFSFAKAFKFIKLSRPIVIICIVAFVGLMFVNIKYFADPIRTQIYSTALEVFKENPALGSGTNSQKSILNDAQLSEKLGYERPLSHLTSMHNQFLDELVQFGVIGVSVLFFIFIMILFYAIKNRNFLMLSVFASWGMYMISDSPMVRANGLILILMCFFLFSNKNISEQKTLQ